MTVIGIAVEDLAALIRREVAAALAQHHPRPDAVLVSYPEAARRLGISLRSVQQRVKDGRLRVEDVGGARMVRLPTELEPR